MKKIFIALFCLFNICEARIVFVHIPKCGGTTLQRLLKENFDKREVYPFAKIGKGRAHATTVQEMQEAFDEFPPIEHELAWGHFPMWFFQEKDPDFNSSFYLTVLRDPVERVLSHDRYRMRNDKLSSDPLSIPDNFLCYMLCTDCTLTGDALLENAKMSLERMDAILFMETFERDIRILFKRLNFKLPSKIPRTNTTRPYPVSDEMIEKIRERNILDVKLYEYAKKRYAS